LKVQPNQINLLTDLLLVLKLTKTRSCQ